jgi:glutathione S-transferase
MLKIHHLGMSRSDRSIWLAEELGLQYELITHTRNPETFRSPQSLWDVSPMGKAPLIEDDGKTIPESGAIVEYILDKYGEGRLRPNRDTAAYIDYLHWMHAAESTLMTPILIDMLSAMTATSSPGLKGFCEGEFKTVFTYMNQILSEREYIAGAFSGADIMVAFPLMMLESPLFASPGVEKGAAFIPYPAIQSYLNRLRARPAWVKAEAIFKSA